jgi:hypothetical protein
MQKLTKPKLVFFQWDHRKAPLFIQLHMQLHSKCLSEFFEVVVINEDCDYQQVCDQYKPDLTLFESGFKSTLSCKINIQNTSTHPQIPKLGFHNGDSWCDCRAGFLSDMEHWGIETFFSISSTIAEHMPEITENLFVWPNFIDADVYRDYALSKTIPVLITGQVASLYPWRQKVNKVITQHFPSLICPHGGYSRSVSRMFHGEQYARVINASWFVPTCGTVAKEVVRKHFEIPASRSCLITEQSPALEAAGFVDMQNCIFADEHNILDKLNYLFQNQDELESIINAGYNLVHSCHTLSQRDQILQWFNLHKELRNNQRIIQNDPFKPLTTLDNSAQTKSASIAFNGLDISLLQQGDEKLWAGKYEEAEVAYIKCINHIPWMPEPKLKLALCNLYKGDVNAALYWIVQPIQYTLGDYKAPDPDPVEWGYYAISLLCSGKLDEAKKHVDHFPLLSHPELDRARWVINFLSNPADKGDLQQYGEGKSKYRYSIHQLPHRSFEQWIQHLCEMLNACQQIDLAKTLTRAISSNVLSVKKKSEPGTHVPFKPSEDLHAKQQEGFTFILSGKVKYPLHLSFFKKLWFLQTRKKLKVKPKILYFLNWLEARFGYFLPYSLSEMRNDDFFEAIQKLAAEENFEKVLIIGASAGKGSTEALMASISGKQKGVSVFCINTSNRRFAKLQAVYANNSLIKFYTFPSFPSTLSSNELVNLIKNIKQENQINSFDTILVDGSEFNFSVDLTDEIPGTRYVLLNGISTSKHCKNHSELLMNSSYTLIHQNPCLREGYSIFQKVSLSCDKEIEAIASLRE